MGLRPAEFDEKFELPLSRLDLYFSKRSGVFKGLVDSFFRPSACLEAGRVEKPPQVVENT